ncbi:MAG: acyl-CoA dehydrogenase family protein [Planctomycetes bacterium]|nr:acyl-CoA dehydrogenase family protein [Planctomycetota bacterium]
MDGLLSKENREWRERVRALAEKAVRPVAARYDRAQEYPWEIQKALAKEGIFKVWIPEEYGGAGGERILNLCIVVEELSRACGGVGVLFAVNALGSFPIILGGTGAQKEKWLPKLAAGETLIAYCLSEKGSGSDAASMRCRARRDGNEYVIDGEKKWTTNGQAANLYTVFAVTDPKSKSRRISGILVEKGTPGFTFSKIEDKMGIRCVPVVESHFRNCRVPADHVLGGLEGYGFRHAMATLDIARPGVAAQAVGLAQGALEWALVYTSRRKQFGQRIIDFQAVQHMLADMATKVEAARQLVYAAARAADRGLDNLTRLSAMCKLYATDVAMEVTTNAVQLFGGYGYMRDYPIEKYMRDAKITQIYEGTNQVQRLVISRNLMKEATLLAELLDPYLPKETQYVLDEGPTPPEAAAAFSVPAVSVPAIKTLYQ